jgi:hypothetical protein
VLGSLVAQFSERDEVARTEIAKGFDAWIGGLAVGLRRIQAAGEIGPRADPEELATGLMAALQGGYTLAQATRAIAPMETALSMIDHIESFGATGDGTTASRAPRSRAQSRRRRYFRHLPWRGRRHLDADRDSVGYPKARSLAPTRLEGTATAAATRSTRGRVR